MSGDRRQPFAFVVGGSRERRSGTVAPELPRDAGRYLTGFAACSRCSPHVDPAHRCDGCPFRVVEHLARAGAAEKAAARDRPVPTRRRWWRALVKGTASDGATR